MCLFRRIPAGPGSLVPPTGLVRLEKSPGGKKPAAVKVVKASVVDSETRRLPPEVAVQ
ncbi:hypothetical protein [Streptomyces hirsutus]|uniref:hypothetical protein n=1 Tax=Streptomyces hirsutus TaxID=35620 RepID=UPI0036499A95